MPHSINDLTREQDHLKQILINFIYGAGVSVGISSGVADEVGVEVGVEVAEEGEFVGVDVLPPTLMAAYISSPKNTPSLFDILQLL